MKGAQRWSYISKQNYVVEFENTAVELAGNINKDKDWRRQTS